MVQIEKKRKEKRKKKTDKNLAIIAINLIFLIIIINICAVKVLRIIQIPNMTATIYIILFYIILSYFSRKIIVIKIMTDILSDNEFSHT